MFKLIPINRVLDLPTGCTDLATLDADIVAGQDLPQCKTCDTGYGLDDADNQCYGKYKQTNVHVLPYAQIV